MEWQKQNTNTGKGKEKPNLYLGNDKLEYVQTYKYLGITMNNKGNLENHIKEIKKKTEAAYQTILAILGNKCYNNIELETAWKLVETCIQPIITYGGETWSLNKKEERNKQKDTNGTSINTNRTTIYRNRAAGHHYPNDQKQAKHGKKTT